MIGKTGFPIDNAQIIMYNKRKKLRGDAMRKILIKNGRAWTGACFEETDVLIEGEKIARIEKGIESDDAEITYDASGKIVSAGLIDIHVHMRSEKENRIAFRTR